MIEMKTGGMRRGEMSIIASGRQVGKSQFTQQAIDRLVRDINSQPISDLVLSEGTVYGARYYCVEPVGGSWPEMEQWCYETFGGTGSIWQETKNLTPESCKRWYANNRKFWFRNERDRTVFLLKWSR